MHASAEEQSIAPAPATGLRGRLGEVLGLVRRGGAGRAFAIGTLTSFLIQVTGTGLSFLLQILIARKVGKTQYGEYVYILGWVNVAVLFSKLNFDIVAARFVGAYRAQEAWGLLHGFIRRSVQLIAGCSLAVGVVWASGIFIARGRLTSTEMLCALLATGLVPATALLTLTGAELQGLRRVVQAQAPNLIVRPLLLGAGLLVMVGVRSVIDAPIVMGANLAATTLALALSYTLLRRETPTEARTAEPRYATKEWVHVGLWLLLADVFQLTVSQQSDVLVVGSMLTKADAGTYSAASQLASLVQFGVMAVSFMAAPTVAGLYAQGRRDALQKLLTNIARANLALSLPLAIALLLAGRLILGLYGKSFAEGYPVLVVLTLSQVIIAGLGASAGAVMSMTGQQRAAAWMIGLSAGLYLALALVLTPRYGSIGTAVATLASVITRSLSLAIYIRLRFGLSLLPIMPRG